MTQLATLVPMLAVQGIVASGIKPLPAGAHRLRFARFGGGLWSAPAPVGVRLASTAVR